MDHKWRRETLHHRLLFAAPMVIERLILAVAFTLCLPNSGNSLSLSSLPRETTDSTANPATFSFGRMLGSPALFLSVIPATSPSRFVKSITIGASVAIGAFTALLAIIFVVFYRRMANRKRPHNVYNVELPWSQRPALCVDTNFPVEMKPAYLDSPRARRSSIVAEPIGPLAGDQILSPLAASQQPGFVPRPVPANVPVSVPVSRAPSLPHSRAVSVQFSNAHSHYSYGVPPNDLAELLDELSRHYVLTDSASPVPMQQRHHHSTSLTGRSRVFRAYSDGV
ncbi:hypothetical protein MVEN_00560100 [Mycena venus]|uniref:Transmembrane protein n=1 Tax=Mycena venus TaxID=2733690 RepID=A0A8H7D7Z3_9AGAR|nr:hypothetical protein MVEN_00560100 [Mycena venus]